MLALDDVQRERAVATLRQTLRKQSKWIKVHAAEFLLDVNVTEGVAEEFRAELSQYGDEPQYRMGIWRVLFRCPALVEERSQRLERITAAALNPAGPDRLHAVETLAKLDVKLTPSQRASIRQWTNEAASAEAAYGHWLLAQPLDADRESHVRTLLAFAASDAALERLRASYALARLVPLAEPESVKLIGLADSLAASPRGDDTLQPLADAYLVAAAWSVAVARNDADATARLRGALQTRAGHSPAIDRVFVDQLAELGNAADVELLVPLLDDVDPDLAASAAHALLRIDQRALTGSN